MHSVARSSDPGNLQDSTPPPPVRRGGAKRGTQEGGRSVMYIADLYRKQRSGSDAEFERNLGKQMRNEEKINSRVAVHDESSIGSNLQSFSGVSQVESVSGKRCSCRNSKCLQK